MRAGLVAVVAAAGLFGVASPAFAANVQLSNVSIDPSTIAPGGEATLRFTVKTSDNMAGNADINVSSNNGKVTCVSGCSVDNADIGAGGTQFQAKVKASGTFTNDESAKITVTVSGVEGTSGEQSSQQTINIDAPQQQAPTVPEISGQVVNVFDNTPIAAAKVFIQDSGSPSQTWEVGTDSQGNFKITSASGKPISPGTVSVIVEKDGFKQDGPATKQAVAGQPLTGFRIPIAPLVSASAAPTLTPGLTSPGVSGLPTDAGPGFEPPDEGGLSWVLIAVGGLLVLLGIGAIVLLFVKRKGDEEDEDGDRPRGRRGGPPGGPGRGGPRPPQRRGGPPPDRTAIMRGPGGPGGPGGPPGDPHRPMRPVSPGPRGADQTMIARSPLADAPTQLHRLEPDPYGHRPGSPGPYPAAGGGYPGGQPAPAYPGGAPGYGQPDPHAQPGYTGPPDQYGRPAPPPQPTYGQPYGQQPDPYAPNPDPRAQRSGQDPRRVDWLDD